jgi:probable O-glycosylation ligase (exosortase A-associated)
MPLRDLLLFGMFGAIMPMALLHPYIGALMWVLFGVMNPHRLTYGPAYNFPFAMVIALITFTGIMLTRDHRQIKGGPAAIVLVVLAAWMTFTTLQALTPVAAWPMWSRVMKIFVMTFVLMLLLHTKRQVDLLIAAIVVSIAFYGVKGGIFTVVTGGEGTVWGPEDSMIQTNNALGVANVMIIPLLMHFYQQTRKTWLRAVLVSVLLLCAASILGSYSRGAVLALGAMCAVLWARSSYKAITFGVVVLIGLVMIPFMPERWVERMHTIQTYEMESSAMSRIYAWKAAWNIAVDRFQGGGFEYPTKEVMAKYSPGPYISVAHSIYFQALGEHGFLGLALFLTFWLLVWRKCGVIRARARDRPHLQWAFSLMSMTQASLAGYAVGGAFLNLAFWDMPYYLYAATVVTEYVVNGALASATPDEASPARVAVGNLSGALSRTATRQTASST